MPNVHDGPISGSFPIQRTAPPWGTPLPLPSHRTLSPTRIGGPAMDPDMGPDMFPAMGPAIMGTCAPGIGPGPACPAPAEAPDPGPQDLPHFQGSIAQHHWNEEQS